MIKVDENSRFEITRGSLGEITKQGGWLRIIDKCGHNITVQLSSLDPLFFANNRPQAPSEVRTNPIEMKSVCIESAQGNMQIKIDIIKLRLYMLHQSKINDLILNGARRGETELIIDFFEPESFYNEILGPAVYQAAGSGQTETVRALLAKEQISAKHRGDAVVQASQHGYTEIVAALLENGAISDQNCSTALYAAIFSNHREIVIHFLKIRIIQLNDYYLILKIAVTLGRREILNILLSHVSIPQSFRDSLLRIAVERGKDEIVRDLLASGSISDESQTEALGLAAQNGYIETLKVLLSNRSIPDECRSEALGLAAERAHTEIVTELLAIGPISDEKLGRVQFLAGENMDILKILLISKSISTKDYSLDFHLAVRNRSEKNLNDLISHGSISESFRGLLLRIAVEKGYDTSFVEMLLKSGKISDEDYVCALEIAVNYGMNIVLQHLLKIRTISSDNYSLLLQRAAQKGHTGIIRSLLSLNILISHKFRYLLVVVASKRRDLQLLKYLLAKGTIPEEVWILAFKEASEQGYKEIILALHANRITVESDPAMTEAAHVAQVGIDDSLRSYFLRHH